MVTIIFLIGHQRKRQRFFVETSGAVSYTHLDVYKRQILDIADEIILLSDGIIKAHGSKEEIMPMVLGTNTNGVCEKLKA